MDVRVKLALAPIVIIGRSAGRSLRLFRDVQAI
jgi:hypothetical protein